MRLHHLNHRDSVGFCRDANRLTRGKRFSQIQRNGQAIPGTIRLTTPAGHGIQPGRPQRNGARLQADGHRFQVDLPWRQLVALAHFLSAILRGLASALFQIVSVSTPASSLASTRSPSAVSGSEKLRENEPYCRS